MVYADSKDMNIEYMNGSDDHSSTWAKFYVRGLDKWAVRERDDEPESDKHANHQQFVALDIPEGTVFTIFEQDGDKRGTSTYKFLICQTSREINAIKAEYGDRRHCSGNFEIICKGEGKTKAPRLFQWWLNFVGEDDKNGRTIEA